MKTFTLLLTLLLLPTGAFAQTDDAITLRDRAAYRGVQRLEQSTQLGIRAQFVRLGRNVRTRDMSMRRLQNFNEGIVTDVVDGSVIVVELANGTTEVVRTLGAEAPLLNTGSDTAQCFALEAQFALSHLLLNKPVTLERDRNYQRDNAGRLLRYVRLNSLDINGWMIGSGYAYADDNVAHRRFENYQLRETEARDYDRGLWGTACDYNPNPRLEFDVLQ